MQRPLLSIEIRASIWRMEPGRLAKTKLAKCATKLPFNLFLVSIVWCDNEKKAGLPDDKWRGIGSFGSEPAGRLYWHWHNAAYRDRKAHWFLTDVDLARQT